MKITYALAYANLKIQQKIVLSKAYIQAKSKIVHVQDMSYRKKKKIKLKKGRFSICTTVF